jgi:hypothetical protein
MNIEFAAPPLLMKQPANEEDSKWTTAVMLLAGAAYVGDPLTNDASDQSLLMEIAR